MQINPFLSFGGRCLEAMNFYKHCFDGELTVQKVSESSLAGIMPPQYDDQVFHCSLTWDGITIMATDMTREKLVFGNAMQICITCASEEEIEYIFDYLSVDGTVIDPLQHMFFGTLGTLTDKFGIRWLLNFPNEDDN